MKKITLLLAIFIAITSAFAQSPNSFKYQTVVRDAAGEVITNQAVSFQFKILQGSASGSSVYTETHSVTTNEFGLVNLNIGAGSTSDDFSTIDWSNGSYFIKVELDENGGTAFSEMGTSQLLSVPYAMYANDVANKDDADADPNNELQIMNFSNDTLYLDNGGQVYLGDYSSLWGQNDTNIYYNNGWVGVGTSTPSGMMVVQGDDGVDPDSALFEVKNKEGQTIFAVYDGGVRIWVDDTGAKSNTDKGGFAVGGYRLNKSISSEYLRVTPDSVRVYIREDDGTKANTDKGGFAVGGYRMNKSLSNEYFNINPTLDADTLNPSEARIFWYPLKEAFLSGRVLVESADSVGLNSWASGFESKSIGNYSQALGYSARAKGNNSTAIGNNAVAEGNESYSFGNYAKTSGIGSYAIGSGATASGLRSFAIGSVGVDSLGVATSPTIAQSDYSFAIGMGSVASNIGSFAIGTQDSAMGDYSFAMGYQSKTFKPHATAIGLSATADGRESIAMGTLCLTEGSNSVAIGYRAEVSADRGGVAIGHWLDAGGRYSIAMGRYTTTSGISSVAIGEYSRADGHYSYALGYHATATEQSAIAIGNHASALGVTSIAIGGGTGRGVGAKSFGSATIARSYVESVFGYYNDTTLSTSLNSWVDTDPIFMVGNGTTSTTRHNALTIIKNGQTNIYPVNSTKGLFIDHNMDATGSTFGIHVDLDNDYTGSSYNYGVYSAVTNNNGSYATYGLRGYATGTSTGVKYGVYGSTSGSGTQYAVYASGDLAYTGSLLNVSDKKFKENINELDNVLPRLMQVKTRSFTYKRTKEFEPMGFPIGAQFGVIAQELETVFPELVVNGSHPGNINDENPKEITYKGVKYVELVPIAIKAIQEQQVIIEQLQEKINQLESENSEIEQLKAELKKIKQILELK